MNVVLLIFLLTSLTAFAQLAVPTFQPQFIGGRATHGSLNMARPNQFNSQRMTPYGSGNTQQQPQTQPQKKELLRARNNRYPVNRSNTMDFSSYSRVNLRDNKAQALAAKQYKEKLSIMRINLRAYRIQPVQPVAPTPPTQPQPQQPQPPQPQPPNEDNPDDPDEPDNNGGQMGIGGEAGSNPPQFPTEPQTRPAVLPTQPPTPIAVGMPAPMPRVK